ncbi:MAG TPA: ABC transporter permease [Ramlibacter sp.]|uniref:ABC transporter permease n=1 Tax=Ramlibacter sp. TaxID=1917967 RepID=UPI002C038F2B|nr:ABC transporter permease [Ramlibacter sp.]HVZ43852.1 ABC transporter permease [Ramlibacter sp.]
MNYGLFVLRRLAAAVPLLLAVVTVNFLLVRLAPGDPIVMIIGEAAQYDESLVREVRARFGLDGPLWQQYLSYVGRVCRGDLGMSIYFDQQPVASVIAQRLPQSALLVSISYALAVAAGVFFGTRAARRPFSATDHAATVVGLLGYSVPSFWLGMLLILVFSLKLGWLPVGGLMDVRSPGTGWAMVLDRARHLVLPVIALGAFHLALITRLTRASMLEVLTLDFITMARSKGLRESEVFRRHALRNALLPVVTTAGYTIGFLLAGSVLVETVFAYPGIGRLLHQALIARDYPLMLGILIVVSVTVVLANLATDLLYAKIDPRIRVR